jgi:dipeptidyl-peptidase 4
MVARSLYSVIRITLHQVNLLAADAKLEKQLTHGEYEVLGVEAVDENAGIVYFSGNRDDPRQRHIYSISGF